MRGGVQELLMIVMHSFRSLQETFEARASEWMLTGATISLGLVFFANDTMFSQEAFSGLRKLANNQLGWAWLFTVIGLSRFAMLCINGSYWRTPHFRAMGAFLSSGIWFVIGAAFIKNGSLLAAIMPWIFFLDAYNVKRASKEAGKSEFIQRYVRSMQGQVNAGHHQGAQR